MIALAMVTVKLQESANATMGTAQVIAAQASALVTAMVMVCVSMVRVSAT